MKIEDIKPGDVIVCNNDEKLVKVAEVTSECHVMESAFYERDKAFCIFQKPRRLPLFSEDEYEPATEEQRQYMESKLAAFYGTNPEVESKRFAALATMMGDLKQENIELAERVKELMDDYNRVVKRINSYQTLSDLTEALDKLEELERDRDFFKKEYDHGQKLYESLFNQHDIQSKELKVVREERDEAKEQYNELQHKHEELQKQYETAKDELQKPSDELRKAYDDYRALRDLNDTANSRLARFENSEFVSMNCYCDNYHRAPFGVDVYVGSTTCQKCEHFMKINNTGDGTVLCAYRYDKEKEKQQERNRYLNEK